VIDWLRKLSNNSSSRVMERKMKKRILTVSALHLFPLPARMDAFYSEDIRN
jgi:hypothetical protein